MYTVHKKSPQEITLFGVKKKQLYSSFIRTLTVGISISLILFGLAAKLVGLFPLSRDITTDRDFHPSPKWLQKEPFCCDILENSYYIVKLGNEVFKMMARK